MDPKHDGNLHTMGPRPKGPHLKGHHGKSHAQWGTLAQWWETPAHIGNPRAKWVPLCLGSLCNSKLEDYILQITQCCEKSRNRTKRCCLTRLWVQIPARIEFFFFFYPILHKKLRRSHKKTFFDTPNSF